MDTATLNAPATIDCFHQGQAHGSVAQRLMRNNMDPSVLRPWEPSGPNGKGDPEGRAFITRNINGKLVNIPVTNATSTLLIREWILLDEAIMRAATVELAFVKDLRDGGLEYTIPNGMAKTVLQFQRQSIMTPATMSMDGLRKGEADRPEYDYLSLPLPLIHKDFEFSAREIETSRNGDAPLDTSSAELAAIQVAILAEQLAVGVGPAFSFGGGSIYGVTNFPQRQTTTVTSPTDGGWTPASLVDSILAMLTLSKNAFHYGPWMLYFAPNWDEYLDNDYSSAKGDNTLRERIKRINKIMDAKTLYLLTNYDIVLVEWKNTTMREVVGMDFTTMMWETDGGLSVHMKVMCMLTPQPRADLYANCGIVHATGV